MALQKKLFEKLKGLITLFFIHSCIVDFEALKVAQFLFSCGQGTMHVNDVILTFLYFNIEITNRPLDREFNFLISQPKHMLF